MTTVFLDAVFKPFFFKNRPWHGPTTDDRSDEFPDGWLPSNHSTYGVCECKHAISNTPKEKKKSHVERSGERGGHGTSPKREMRCPGNMFRTMVIESFAVCAVAPSCWNHTLAQFILLRRNSEYYPFKRCQVPVGHSVFSVWFLIKRWWWSSSWKTTYLQCALSARVVRFSRKVREWVCLTWPDREVSTVPKYTSEQVTRFSR